MSWTIKESYIVMLAIFWMQEDSWLNDIDVRVKIDNFD